MGSWSYCECESECEVECESECESEYAPTEYDLRWLSNQRLRIFSLEGGSKFATGLFFHN